MKLSEFKKTPFYKNVAVIIKVEGWEKFKKQYPSHIKSAELWLSIQKTLDETEKLIRKETKQTNRAA